MPLLLQHLVVLCLVGACLTAVGWQTVRALAGRRSRVGSCCAKGCATTEPANKPATQAVQFIPVEMLTRRK